MFKSHNCLGSRVSYIKQIKLNHFKMIYRADFYFFIFHIEIWQMDLCKLKCPISDDAMCVYQYYDVSPL